MRYQDGVCSSDGKLCQEMCFQWKTCDTDIIGYIVGEIRKFDSNGKRAYKIDQRGQAEWSDLFHLNKVIQESRFASAIHEDYSDRGKQIEIPNRSAGQTQESLSFYPVLETGKNDVVLSAETILKETEEVLIGLNKFT